MERTTELVQQNYYWPGMGLDIRNCVQRLELCHVTKDSALEPHSYMGYLLTSSLNENRGFGLHAVGAFP